MAGEHGVNRCQHGHDIFELCGIAERVKRHEALAEGPPAHEDHVLAAPLSLSLSLAQVAGAADAADEHAAHLWVQDVDGRTVSGTIGLESLTGLAEGLADVIRVLMHLRGVGVPDDASALADACRERLEDPPEGLPEGP